jgi:hypothetical protein
LWPDPEGAQNMARLTCADFTALVAENVFHLAVTIMVLALSPFIFFLAWWRGAKTNKKFKSILITVRTAFQTTRCVEERYV